MRLVFLLPLAALAACADPVPSSEPAPEAADTLGFSVDSLVRVEVEKREAERRQERERLSRRVTSSMRRARMWHYARDGDWSDAPDSLLVDMLHLALEGDEHYRHNPSHEASVPLGPPRPLGDFANGLPRDLDPYAHRMDSLVAAHGISGRVLVESRTDTLYRQGSFGGFALYALTTVTEVRLPGAPPQAITPSPDLEGGPRETHALLAVRDSRAEPLVVSRINWTELAFATEQTPDGPVLAVDVHHRGARIPNVFYVERRNGAWSTLARPGDVYHGTLPFMAEHHWREFHVDLGAMELRSSIWNPDGGAGCFVTSIVRQGGRLARGRTAWHRDVESCHEYAFERLPPAVRTDTVRFDVAPGKDLQVTLRHRASGDTTTQYDWRLMDPGGRLQWSGSIPAGTPPDSTYAFRREEAAPGEWRLVQTRREDTPRYAQTHRPPRVSVSAAH